MQQNVGSVFAKNIIATNNRRMFIKPHEHIHCSRVMRSNIMCCTLVSRSVGIRAEHKLSQVRYLFTVDKISEFASLFGCFYFHRHWKEYRARPWNNCVFYVYVFFFFWHFTRTCIHYSVGHHTTGRGQPDINRNVEKYYNDKSHAERKTRDLRRYDVGAGRADGFASFRDVCAKKIETS